MFDLKDFGKGYESEYSISARIGKHFCPYCNNTLQVKRKKQVVDMASEEAKKFSYYPIGGIYSKYVEFRWDVFYCANCNIEIPIGDILIYERKLKKAGGNLDFDEFRKGFNIAGKNISSYSS